MALYNIKLLKENFDNFVDGDILTKQLKVELELIMESEVKLLDTIRKYLSKGLVSSLIVSTILSVNPSFGKEKAEDMVNKVKSELAISSDFTKSSDEYRALELNKKIGFIDDQINKYPSHYDEYKGSTSVVGNVKNSTEAVSAFIEMQSAAKKDNIILTPLSGFRGYDKQHDILLSKSKKMSLSSVLDYSAPVGKSEHHLGTAFDINSLNPGFSNTKEYKWLQSNAKSFGFKMTYDGNTTGAKFEPWHWNYVGK